MPLSKIKIIYEDKDVVAVNKPAGVSVHHDTHHKSGTIVDWLLERLPTVKNVGDEPNIRPGIVHRLDKDTSGILIIAKTQPAFEYLKKQFQERRVIKKYAALVAGKIKTDEGEIALPIGRSKKDPTKRVAIGDTLSLRAGAVRGAREALTRYKVLERFSEYTMVEADLKTGRTHQIRAHFKALGHPVACDKLYGGKHPKCPEGLARHFLHASSLELALPSGSRIKLEADLPEDLANAVKGLRKQ